MYYQHLVILFQEIHLIQLFCKQTVKEIMSEISKISPRMKIEVGGYQIDGHGNQKQRTLQYRKSEIYLTEVMENICKKMENYIKAKHKNTGEIIVMSILGEGGEMNPLMGEVDIIQDAHLNKNLKTYCEEILEIYDEEFIKNFQKDVANPEEEICVTSEICVASEDKNRDEL
ncbi:protein seele-like isoform X2 [Lycorma delicatula]|uniref:protein seele-like isoform X2 n=1 Tax=Lycorma delicatula TaxID=130591 RepID=UPI003F519F76